MNSSKRRIFPDFTHSDSDILQIYRDVVDKWCISARFRFYIIPRNSLAAEDRNIFYEIVSYVERVLNRSAYDFLPLADLFHLFHFMQRVLQSPRRKSCDTRQSLFHFMLHAISLSYILKRTLLFARTRYYIAVWFPEIFLNSRTKRFLLCAQTTVSLIFLKIFFLPRTLLLVFLFSRDERCESMKHLA